MTTRELKAGEVVGNRYRLDRELGHGAMGVVFQATHQKLGNKVAIKFLDRSFNKVPEVVERFVREGRAALSIGHPGIVGVLDFGEMPDGTSYLVMEHLDGLTLRQLLKKTGALKPRIASAVLVPVLEALEAAHAVGVIHRDLKPANVMLTTKRAVKLVDFGISKMDESKLTRAGVAMGTPDYMAPEQTTNAINVTSAADLYSVGVIAFELMAGRLPIIADSVPELMFKVMTEAPPSLGTVVSGVDPRVVKLIDSLLVKDPQRRPRSAAEVRKTLATVVVPDAAGLWTLVNTPDEDGMSNTYVRPSPQAPSNKRPRATDAAQQALEPLPSQVPTIPPRPNPAVAQKKASPSSPTRPSEAPPQAKPFAITEQVSARTEQVPLRTEKLAPLKEAAMSGWEINKTDAPASLGALGDVTLHKANRASLGELNLHGDLKGPAVPLAVSKERKAAPSEITPPRKSAAPMIVVGVGVMVLAGIGVGFFAGGSSEGETKPVAEAPAGTPHGNAPPVEPEKKPAPPTEPEKKPEPVAVAPAAVPTPAPAPAPAAEKAAPAKPGEKAKPAEKGAAPAKSSGGLSAAFGQFQAPPPAESAPAPAPAKAAEPVAAPPPAEKPAEKAPEAAPAEKAAEAAPPAEKPAEAEAEPTGNAAELYQVGQAALRAEKLKDARKAFRRCANVEPDNADCVCALAQTLTLLEESDAAQKQNRKCEQLRSK